MAKQYSANPTIVALEQRRLARRIRVEDVAALLINPTTRRPVMRTTVFRWIWGRSVPSVVLLERWEKALSRLERKGE